MHLSNNFNDMYGIVLKDKIDANNYNLKATPSMFFKISCMRVDFDKSDFDFFYQILKLVFRFLKSFLSLSKEISNGP